MIRTLKFIACRQRAVARIVHGIAPPHVQCPGLILGEWIYELYDYQDYLTFFPREF